jgi:hypothetical protein
MFLFNKLKTLACQIKLYLLNLVQKKHETFMGKAASEGLCLFILFIILSSIPGLAQDKKASYLKGDVYLTAKNTNDRITKKESLKFEPLEQPDEHTPH